MNIEGFRNYCINKKGATENFPFGDETLVFKVMEKIFAMASLDEYPSTANLKCDPEKAILLRDEYGPRIRPGYHMNKKHWNTVEIGSNLPSQLIVELIDHSYDLVVRGLSKKAQQTLKEL